MPESTPNGDSLMGKIVMQMDTIDCTEQIDANPLLTIAIPTYNRAEFLDHILEYHIPLARKHNIQIQVFDNASTDQTREVTYKWKKKYPLVFYISSEVNHGPDANIERALKAQTTQYVWLLGDTYHIPEGAIEYIFDKLDRTEKYYDMFIFNVNDDVKHIATRDYRNKNEILREMFPHITWLPALVYSARLIQNARFERYAYSRFIQTGIILEYIADREFLIHWNRDLSVKMIWSVNGRQKDFWASDGFFEIWIDRRSNLVMSLPVAYTTKDKLDAIKRSSHFGIKEMVRSRSLNIYTPEACRQYAHLLPLNIRCSKFVAAAIVRTPRFVVAGLYNSYLFLKNLLINR